MAVDGAVGVREKHEKSEDNVWFYVAAMDLQWNKKLSAIYREICSRKVHKNRNARASGMEWNVLNQDVVFEFVVAYRNMELVALRKDRQRESGWLLKCLMEMSGEKIAM